MIFISLEKHQNPAMKNILHIIAVVAGLFCITSVSAKSHEIPFEKGRLVVTPLQDNAVRIKYIEGETAELPELIYISDGEDIS